MAYAQGIFPDCFCQCPCPCGESQLPHTSTGDPPTLTGSFASVSYGVTAPFLWVLVHTKFCLCSSRLESLFPSALWKSCNQILLASKSDSLEIPSSAGLQDWEDWCGAQILHKSGNTSFILLFSSLWFTHLVGMRFEFVMIVLLYHLAEASSSFNVVPLFYLFIYFFEFQHPPVEGCSIASCNFDAVCRGRCVYIIHTLSV